MPQTWHITNQQLRDVVNPDGPGFSQQWNVGYLIHSGPAAGVRGEIHVPTSQLDPDIVKQAIDAMVDKHQAVAALGNA